MRKKRFIVAAVLGAIVAAYTLVAQETMLSYKERYFDFLALNGEIDRPYLNYRTLSDSDWDGPEKWILFGPELFFSYNTTSPYGVNDGLLWQGKGLNASFNTGFRYASQGLEITFKPEIVFSQNQSFKLMDSAYPSEYGYIWGYSFGAGADAPQRFGSHMLADFGWGDSEARFTWKNATIGLGTQSPWVGPGRINAIMHSNNAPPYPKADIGIRRMPVSLWGWYAGDLEARLWAGYLSESDYFDDDESNDHNLISAVSVAYAPTFLPGLTVFANRSYLAPWKPESAKSLASLFFVDLEGGGAQDVWDQRASIGFDYLLPRAGVEVYGEAGINDYSPSWNGYVRYPFHSMVYTGGVRKAVDVAPASGLRGELLFEWSNLEMSQDYQFQYPASFYMHYQILQGYTNGGQWLGAGIGTGGNSQYLGFKLYQNDKSAELFVQRVNPDNDYLYRLSVRTVTEFDAYIRNFKALFCIGLKTNLQMASRWEISNAVVFVQEHNPYYSGSGWLTTEKQYNLHLESRVKYRF